MSCNLKQTKDQDTKSTWHRTVFKDTDPYKVQPFLVYHCIEVIKLAHTTQHAKMIIHFPLRYHVKARYKWANVTRLNETTSLDPIFSNVKSAYHGYTGCKVFLGCTTHCIQTYVFNNNANSINSIKTLLENMEHLHSSCDNAGEEKNSAHMELHHNFLIKDELIEHKIPQ